MDIMDTPMVMVMDMDMLSLDTATLMSAASWEKGQLKLMPNPDIMVFHIMVILMDIMDIQLSLQLNLDMNMIFLGTVMLA